MFPQEIEYKKIGLGRKEGRRVFIMPNSNTITLLAIVVVVSLSSLQNTVAFRLFPSPNPFRCQSPPLSPPSPPYNPLLPPPSPPKRSATAAPPPPVPSLPSPLPPPPPPPPPRRGPDFKVDSPPPFPFPPCKRLLRSTVAAAATVSVLQPPPSDQPSTSLPSPALPPPPRRGPDFKVDAPPFGVDSPPYCRRRSDHYYGIHPGPQQYGQDCTDVYDFQPPPPSLPHYGYGRRCSGDDDGPDIHPGPHA